MIANRQRRVRVTIPPLQEFLSRVQKKLKVPADAVSVCFVGDAEMARWNAAYRGKRRSTDVLSFPANGNGARANRSKRRSAVSSPWAANGDSKYLGDIAISPVVARRNARRDGRPLSAELRILILHGVLHLLGYDHETDHGEMELYEQRLRASLGLR
jgi:probable rRNA maturation factor